MLSKKEKEICDKLIINSATQQEAYSAAAVAISKDPRVLRPYVYRKWNQMKAIEGISIVSLFGRQYQEIAAIFRDQYEMLQLGVLKSVRFKVNKINAKHIGLRIRKEICSNTNNINRIRGREVNLVSFNNLYIVVKDDMGLEYQILIWDVSKKLMICEKATNLERV